MSHGLHRQLKSIFARHIAVKLGAAACTVRGRNSVRKTGSWISLESEYLDFNSTVAFAACCCFRFCFFWPSLAVDLPEFPCSPWFLPWVHGWQDRIFGLPCLASAIATLSPKVSVTVGAKLATGSHPVLRSLDRLPELHVSPAWWQKLANIFRCNSVLGVKAFLLGSCMSFDYPIVRKILSNRPWVCTKSLMHCIGSLSRSNVDTLVGPYEQHTKPKSSLFSDVLNFLAAPLLPPRCSKISPQALPATT